MMGRNIPPYNEVSDHPAVFFSLFIACLAATTLVVAALCGVRSRFRKRKTSSESTPAVVQDKNNTETTIATSAKSPPESPSRSPPVSVSPSPLPPPPAIEAQKHAKDMKELEKELSSRKLTIKTPRRRLSTSLSMKMGGTSVARILSRKEEPQQPKQKKLKHEDSLWTKTIMLGEKCRVPDEDEEAIIYDEKGNRVSAYRVRTPRSLPVSRSNSFVEKDTLPVQ